MDWAEDFKFSIKKNVSKKGRRATEQTTSSEKLDREESVDTDIDLGIESSMSSMKGPPKGRKLGVWSDNGLKSGKVRSNVRNLIELERFNTASISSELPSEDDIPIIPDLDDIQDELLMNEVVEPPSVSVNRVATFKELNSDLVKQSAFSALEDIDLTILTRSFQVYISLEEPDEPWEWNQVFTEITAEIHSDTLPSKLINVEELPIHYIN